MKESRYNIWVARPDGHYVYNGIAGALLRVPTEDYRAVKAFLGGQPGATCRPALLVELARGRMLVPDELDELELLATRYRASRYDTSHFALTIVTSLGCNFDCPYCFEAKHPSIMKPDVQEAVLQILDDKLPTIKSFHVAWYGGEPLVGKQPLLALSDAFIERCDRAEVAYSADITTNGYLLDEETCQQLRDRRVASAQITLDGPPEVHDRMRPLAGGGSTFWRIVENLHHVVNYLGVAIRVNVDAENFPRVEELLRILADEGLASKLSVYPGQIVAVDDGVPAPSTSYHARCFSKREFAEAELRFQELAQRYGFPLGSLPQPVPTPCTAVRANELVVGSYGELYKCWESVGNHLEIIGDIRHYQQAGGRMQKWLKYDPFTDEECRGCVALPVCMGGCAAHAMDPNQHDNRCETFRHTYREQVLGFVDRAEQEQVSSSAAPSRSARPVEPR
jgi:uncharacterized protein